MKIRATLTVLLALTTAAVAAPWGVEKPPGRYMVEPTQPYEVQWVSQEEVNHTCRGELALGYIQAVAAGIKPRTVDAYACTDVNRRVVRIVRSLYEQHPLVDQVLWHEKAHLNGWRHPPRN